MKIYFMLSRSNTYAYRNMSLDRTKKGISLGFEKQTIVRNHDGLFVYFILHYKNKCNIIQEYYIISIYSLCSSTRRFDVLGDN